MLVEAGAVPEWPALGGQWRYAARGFYGNRVEPPSRMGECAVVVGLADKPALWVELLAFKARMQRGDIGKVEVLASHRPSETFTYWRPRDIPERSGDLP